MRIKKSQRKRIENHIRRLRIELLAKPKPIRLKRWPDPTVYRKVPWKVPRAAMTAVPSEQILRLYAPKKDFARKPPSMCVEPGHYVSQYALKAVVTPRVAKLAKPKRLHKPPPPPPKTKRQLKREKELRRNLDESMRRLARPPRTEIVKKPEPGEEETAVPPTPAVEPPQPPPTSAAARKPQMAASPAVGRAGTRPNVPTPAQPAPAPAPVPSPAPPRGKRPSVQMQNKTAAPTAPSPAPAPAPVDAKAGKQPAIVTGAKKK